MAISAKSFNSKAFVETIGIMGVGYIASHIVQKKYGKVPALITAVAVGSALMPLIPSEDYFKPIFGSKEPASVGELGCFI